MRSCCATMFQRAVERANPRASQRSCSWPSRARARLARVTREAGPVTMRDGYDDALGPAVGTRTRRGRPVVGRYGATRARSPWASVLPPLVSRHVPEPHVTARHRQVDLGLGERGVDRFRELALDRLRVPEAIGPGAQLE